jgi:hypothetical protein
MENLFIQVKTRNAELTQKLAKAHDSLNSISCNDVYLSTDFEVLDDSNDSSNEICIDCIDALSFTKRESYSEFVLITSKDKNGSLDYNHFVQELIARQDHQNLDLTFFLIDTSNLIFYAHIYNSESKENEFVVYENLIEMYEKTFELKESTLDTHLFDLSCQEMAMDDYLHDFIYDLLHN